MTTDELIKALRNTDWSDGCPCENEHLCKNADCIIIQAADRLEELDGRVAIKEADEPHENEQSEGEQLTF